MIIFKPIYILQNWKLIIHLLFNTYRFGVNNQWWSEFDSMFGKPWYKIRLRQNYQCMKFRAIHCGFCHPNNYYKIHV